MDRPSSIELVRRAADDAAAATNDLELSIVAAWRAGESLRDIAKAADTTHTTVGRIIKSREGDDDMLTAVEPRDEWTKYWPRYAAPRPDTFHAYVDVWKRNVGSVRQTFGGWPSFTMAANAEPAQDPARVAEAERVMELGGYEIGPCTPRGGRTWRREL